MRKILGFMLVFALGLVVMACGGTTTAATTAAPTTAGSTATTTLRTFPQLSTTTEAASEFKVDGEFTAFEAGVSHDAPMVTMVTVTVLDGEITEFAIDVRQGTRTLDGETYTFAWNELTKQELGYNYKMHYNAYLATDTETPTIEEYETWLGANDKLEWFEQADLIAAKWLAEGFDSVTVNVDGDIDNVAGVTISDGGYIDLAAAAVQLAKDGKFQVVNCSGTDLYIASMVVSEAGVVSELTLDTLQKQKGTAADVFAWNVSTKQELGYNYKMHYNLYSATDETPTIEEYETWLGANDKLEWFEQANLITDYIMANGWDEAYVTTPIDTLAGVSVDTEHYYAILSDLFGVVADGVIAE